MGRFAACFSSSATPNPAWTITSTGSNTSDTPDSDPVWPKDESREIRREKSAIRQKPRWKPSATRRGKKGKRVKKLLRVAPTRKEKRTERRTERKTENATETEIEALETENGDDLGVAIAASRAPATAVRDPEVPTADRDPRARERGRVVEIAAEEIIGIGDAVGVVEEIGIGIGIGRGVDLGKEEEEEISAVAQKVGIE